MSKENPPSDETPSTRPEERLAWLHLSGWLPALAVSAAVCVPVFWRQETPAGLVLGACLAVVGACLFALSAGPWLGPWRRSHWRASFLPWSALLGVILVGWTALTLSAIPLAAARLLGEGDDSDNLGRQALSALDLVLNEGRLAGWGLIWVVAVSACLTGREIVRRHPAAVYEETLGRKAMGALLLIPYGLVLGQAFLVVFSGLRLDPEFRRAYGHDIETALGRQGPYDPMLDHLPASFKERPRVSQWLETTSTFDGLVPPDPEPATIFVAWLEEVRRLWEKSSDPWQNRELQAMAQLAHQESLVEKDGVDPALKAEMAIRTQVLLLDRGGVSSTHSQRLYELKLPASEWAALLELALSPPGLAHGAFVTDDILRDDFVAQGVEVLRRTDYDLDGNLQWNLFERCMERARLNHRWRAYQDGKPYAEPATPLTRDQFKRRYQPSLEFQLDAIDDDIGQFTFSNDLARQSLAYNIVLMELKRLEAAGAPLPQQWKDFRPEVASVGQAYSDWIELTPVPGGVNLRRKEPRGGLGLIHSFRQSCEVVG